MSEHHIQQPPGLSFQGAPAQAELAGFSADMRVIFVPNHAMGVTSHPDCEHGSVSSVNHKFVFVKFDAQVSVLGWAGTTAQACDPDNLVKE